MTSVLCWNSIRPIYLHICNNDQEILNRTLLSKSFLQNNYFENFEKLSVIDRGSSRPEVFYNKGVLSEILFAKFTRKHLRHRLFNTVAGLRRKFNLNIGFAFRTDWKFSTRLSDTSQKFRRSILTPLSLKCETCTYSFSNW